MTPAALPWAIGLQDGDDEFLMSHIGLDVNLPHERCSCGESGNWSRHFEKQCRLYILKRRERQRQQRWNEEWR